MYNLIVNFRFCPLYPVSRHPTNQEFCRIKMPLLQVQYTHANHFHAIQVLTILDLQLKTFHASQVLAIYCVMPIRSR